MLLSLHTLPVELVYRILDQLNIFDIHLSCRDICQRLNDIIDIYHRYQMMGTILFAAHKKIDSQQAKTLLNMLHRNKTVNTLHLYNNFIGDQGAKYFANALSQNSFLTTLDLSYNRIGPEGVKHLANALKTNQTLTTLYLSQNLIGTEGFKYLSNALPYNKTLIELYLTLNHTDPQEINGVSALIYKTITFEMHEDQLSGNESVKHLANALHQNETLTTLDLSSNRIGLKGVQYIANALRQNKTLTTLILANNAIFDDEIEVLLNALQENKNYDDLFQVDYFSECLTVLNTTEYVPEIYRHRHLLDRLDLFYENVNTVLPGRSSSIKNDQWKNHAHIIEPLLKRSFLV